jgi:nucleoside-diphosphate-sugar epimerase
MSSYLVSGSKRIAMRTLMTGSTGFIGRHLASDLIRNGHEVYAIVRSQTNLQRLVPGVNARLYDGGIDSLSSILTSIKPDIVIHLAARFQDRHAPGDIEDLIKDNITFGAMLLESMAQSGTSYLINTSTSWQHYQGQDYSPTCLYAATKQAFEALIRYYVDTKGLTVITLKLFDTYGPQDPRGKLVSKFLKMLRDGSSLDMSPGEQLLDLVHIYDVISAYLIAMERLMSGVATGEESYTVSSGQYIKLRELASLFSRCAGAPLQINWGARPYREREVMVPWSTGHSLPGWRPRVRLEEGLTSLCAENV